MEQTLVYVWSGLGAAVGTLALMAAMLWTSKAMLQQIRDLWRVLRGYREEVAAGIDEPTDPVIRELARLTALPPSVWSALLTGLLRSVADGLDTLTTDSSENVASGEYYETTTQL